MFGFFKSKNKDKAVSKDKASDSSKDKKKDKSNKETKSKDQKEIVTLRNKEDKAPSKSLFRKSRSIERTKDKESEGGAAKKRSKTLEHSKSGDFEDSSCDASVRSSTATDEESISNHLHGEEATPPKYSILTGASSTRGHQTTPQCRDGSDKDTTRNSESVSRSDGEPSVSAIRATGECNTGNDQTVNKLSVGDAVMHSKIEKRDFITKDTRTCDTTKLVGKDDIKSGLVVSTTSAFERSKKADEVTFSLTMKPPLNPRIIGPRGPLASSGFTLNSSIQNITQDVDESRFTPSPGVVVTPPSSPGLSGIQVIPPYPVVTGPSSRPTSPDGRASMLSTPSSSTSSLSSLTARPISPSGRRTPPGPRMGTGGRLSSSPTAGRKAVRTNIKTNPSVASRRGGSQSPINLSSSGANATDIPFMDGGIINSPPSSPVTFRHDSEKATENDRTSVSEKEAQIISLSGSTSPQSVRQVTLTHDAKTPFSSLSKRPKVTPPPSPSTKVCFPAEPKLESNRPGTGSASPTSGKSRHSISSLHSLESIPENDSDSQASANNTLERNKGTGVANYKPINPLTTMKESKIKSKSLGYSARHSAPETPSSDRHIHGSFTHKRSSSLTPVSEEKPAQVAASVCSDRKSSPAASIHSKPNRGAISSLSSTLFDHSAAKCNTNTSSSNGQPNSLKEDIAIENGKGSEKNIKDTHALQKNTSKTLANESMDIMSANKNKINAEHNKEESKTAQKVENDDGSSSQMATHVVFRIPLKSNSFSNGQDAERRVSVEILSGREAKEVKRPEKDCHKNRPRSLSTSRELGREKTSESYRRRRSSSHGLETETSDFIDAKVEEEKDKLREKIRHRSSTSSSSRGSFRSRATDEDSQKDANELQSNKENVENSADKPQIAVVPWCRRQRSHSRARDQNELNRETSPTDSATRSSVSRTEERKSVESEVKTETDKSCNDIVESSSSSSRVSRRRSSLREPERRMTRSITLNEITRMKSDNDATSRGSDDVQRRRTRSTSRASESTVMKPGEEGENCVVRRPPRRRSLSSSRRSSSVTADVKSKSHEDEVNPDENSAEPQSSVVSASPVDDDEKIDDKDEVTVRIRRRSSARDSATSHRETSDVKREEMTSDTNKTKDHSSLTDIIVAHKCCIQDTTDVHKKELAAQEERYQKQVDHLTIALAEKQEEVRSLTQRLEDLKSAKARLNDSEQLQVRLDNLQKELREKSSSMDIRVDAASLEPTSARRVSPLDADDEGMKVELQYSKNEVELTKSKLKKLEEDLDAARQKNIALQNQITANTNCDRSEELESKITSLEDRLKISQAEKEKLTKTIEEIESERDEEIKIIQDALEEAAQEREELIASFEKEFQNINTMNTNREQQLMEDFEWKLREMEKEHKKKLEEKDRMAEERINAVRNLVETELAESITKVAEDKRVAEEQLLEVGHLKSYEAEAIQLRGVTHELQKALRASAREMDRLKMREKILEEEIRGLKKPQPITRQNTIHRQRRVADDTEDEFRQKQEKLKSELNAEWEDKLRKECSRLKAELDDLHAEEKHLAVESMKLQKEQEIRTLKQSWELRQEEMSKEISTLKDSLTDKDAYYHKEMENLRTNADRDIWELRRKLQKLDEKNWTQTERLQEKHNEEMERLKQDYKERVNDLEVRLAVTSEHSGEDERRQLEKVHNDELEHLCEQHRNSMERLREELESEKFQAVEEARVIVSQHLEHINKTLKEQLVEATCINTQYREELEAIRAALALREEVIGSLEEELTKVKGGSEGGASFYKASQSSIAYSEESNGSNISQDRLSLSDSLDNTDDAQRSGGGSLLGKVFGGGWFSSGKGKEPGRRGSAPSTDKKPSS